MASRNYEGDGSVRSHRYTAATGRTPPTANAAADRTRDSCSRRDHTPPPPHTLQSQATLPHATTRLCRRHSPPPVPPHAPPTHTPPLLREFVSVSTGTNEHTLMKEDVGRRLAFVYVPVNFEGEEGKSMSIVSQIIKKAPPKVKNLKIIGELKEGSKITVTGIVTGES